MKKFLQCLRCNSLILFAFVIFLFGCSGELHVVSGSPKRTDPAVPGGLGGKDQRPKSPIRNVSESFLYREASGVSQLGFVLYPKKTLQEVNQTLIRSIPNLIRSLGRAFPQKSEIRMGMIRDVQGGSATWFNPVDLGLDRLSWAAPAMRFLIENLSQFSYEKIEQEKDGLVFFDSILASVSALRSRDRLYLDYLSPGKVLRPVWLHFLYFRDRDLDTDLDRQDLELQFQQGWARLKNELIEGPYSPYRLSITLMTHQNPGATCLPENRLSKKLGEALVHLPKQSHEICDFIDFPDRLLSEYVQNVSMVEQKMILSRRPKPNTIRAFSSRQIPPAQIHFDSELNELTLDSAAEVHAGAEVRVDYEVE